MGKVLPLRRLAAIESDSNLIDIEKTRGNLAAALQDEPSTDTTTGQARTSQVYAKGNSPADFDRSGEQIAWLADAAENEAELTFSPLHIGEIPTGLCDELTLEDLGPLDANERRQAIAALLVTRHTNAADIFDALRNARARNDNVVKFYRIMVPTKQRNHSIPQGTMTQKKKTVIETHQNTITTLAYKVALAILEEGASKFKTIQIAQAALPFYTNQQLREALNVELVREIEKVLADLTPNWESTKERLMREAQASLDNPTHTGIVFAEDTFLFDYFFAKADAKQTKELTEALEDLPAIEQISLAEAEQMNISDCQALSGDTKKLFERAAELRATTYESMAHMHQAVSGVYERREAQGETFVKIFHLAGSANTHEQPTSVEVLKLKFGKQIVELARKLAADIFICPEEKATIMSIGYGCLPRTVHVDDRAELKQMLDQQTAELTEDLAIDPHRIRTAVERATYISLASPDRQSVAITQALATLREDEKLLFPHLFKKQFTRLKKLAQKASAARKTVQQNPANEQHVLALSTEALNDHDRKYFTQLYRGDRCETERTIECLLIDEVDDAVSIEKLARRTALNMTDNNRNALIASCVRTLGSDSNLQAFAVALADHTTRIKKLKTLVAQAARSVSSAPYDTRDTLDQFTHNLTHEDRVDFFHLYEQQTAGRIATPSPIAPQQTTSNFWPIGEPKSTTNEAFGHQGVTVRTHKIASYPPLVDVRSTSAQRHASKNTLHQKATWWMAAAALVTGIFTTKPAAHSDTTYHTDVHTLASERDRTPNPPHHPETEAANMDHTVLRGDATPIYFPVSIKIDNEPINLYSALYGYMHSPAFREAFPGYEEGPLDQSRLLNRLTGRAHHLMGRIEKDDVISFGINSEGRIVIFSWTRNMTDLLRGQIASLDALPNLGRFSMRPIIKDDAPVRVVTENTITATKQTPATYSNYALLEKDMTPAKPTSREWALTPPGSNRPFHIFQTVVSNAQRIWTKIFA